MVTRPSLEFSLGVPCIALASQVHMEFPHTSDTATVTVSVFAGNIEGWGAVDTMIIKAKVRTDVPKVDAVPPYWRRSR